MCNSPKWTCFNLNDWKFTSLPSPHTSSLFPLIVHGGPAAHRPFYSTHFSLILYIKVVPKLSSPPSKSFPDCLFPETSFTLWPHHPRTLSWVWASQISVGPSGTQCWTVSPLLQVPLFSPQTCHGRPAGGRPAASALLRPTCLSEHLLGTRYWSQGHAFVALKF